VRRVRSIDSAFGVRLRALHRRMRSKSRAGNAMIEFALIAPVFFLLLMGIMENGVIYFAGATVQNAASNAARYVRTGQAQADGTMNEANFKARICSDITSLLLTCGTNLQVSLTAYPAGYGGASFGSPLTGGTLDPTHNYLPGTACDVVLLRVFYKWKVITPMLSPFLSNVTGGYHLITATAAFRNEPFTSAVAGC
jgi:Flp pilus assembly protein TadG